MTRLLRILYPLCLLCVLTSPLAQAFGDPLPPEKAFRGRVERTDPGTVTVHFEVARGYYLYRDKFKFAAEPASVTLGTPALPEGEIKDDPTFGRVTIYRDALAIPIPITQAGAGGFTLVVTSQGCADIGVCYPPMTQRYPLDIPPSTPPPQDESSRLAGLFHQQSLPALLGVFFAAGLLLALTPCVFPMIPIVSGIIVGHGHTISKWRALELSVLYVLGMAVTYAAVGVAAGLSGTLLSAALQSPWVLGGFAAVFVVLALSMFGLFELQLPTFLQSRLADSARHQKGGSALSVLVMGALSAVIVGPCVAPPLAGALLYIAQTGDAVLGGSALFVMALGMGLPVVAVGVGARQLLPHSGPWMNSVKQVFGVMLLALAWWIVQPVLPPTVALFGWAALLIGVGIFLRAIDPLPPAAHAPVRLAKAVGVVSLVSGLAMLAGALAGWHDPIRPLGFLHAQTMTHATPFARVRTSAELDQRLAAATTPVLLDFYADWCVACKEMERETFAHPEVSAQLQKFTLLQVDVTQNTAEDAALLRRFGLFGPPGIVFFKPGGAEIPGTRVIGFQPPALFLQSLAKAG